MSQSVLATDVRDGAVTEAATHLDGWRVELHSDRELAGAVGADPDVRAVRGSA